MIIYKTQEDIEKIKVGGKILAEIMNQLIKKVEPGVDTGDLEKLAEDLIKEQGGIGAFKGYQPPMQEKPFPTILCTSINNEVVHAPSLPSRILKEGDIIGIDIGLEYMGCFTDMSRTVAVGQIDSETERLIQTARVALDKGLEAFKPGNTVADIGKAIEKYVESQGFYVVRDLVGHGVGKQIHEDPNVPNYYTAEADRIKIEPGMVLALEPMVNMTDWKVSFDNNEWAIKTYDGLPSAHFEDTVALDHNGQVHIITRI